MKLNGFLQHFRGLLGLFILAGGLQAGATLPDFDTCTFRLHKRGGMSLRAAQRECLLPPSEKVLDCQNNRFLFAFQDPRVALSQCRNEGASEPEFRGEAFRGDYEALPTSTSKKTVCSVTVNSAEEREVFRRQLDPNLYDHVELLPEQSFSRFIVRDDFWLQRACKQKLRCDIVLFSGHFAEALLGESGFDVPLSDLTRASGDPKCQDFFESVREVYLFGCNTLAGREPDHRSPSEYAKILTVDGVPPHRAQRVAARRYTKYGESIGAEMRALFPKATDLYGFPSISPTGKNIESSLLQYTSRAYAPSVSKQEKLEVFRRFLGSVGMIRRSALPRRTQAERQAVLQEKQLLTRKGLIEYVEQYASILPVPVVDVIKEGRQKQLLTEKDVSTFRNRLGALWERMDLPERRSLLCPLLLADHEEWLPKDLFCRSYPAWLQGLRER